MVTFNDFIGFLASVWPCSQLDIFCGIIALIVILFVSALLALLASLGSFSRERYQLSVLHRLLSDIDRGLIHDMEVFYKMVFSRLNQDTLVYERVELIYSLLGNQNIPLTLSDVSDLTIAKKEAEFKNQLVNFVIAVLLIIGLAGTFWAFRDILTNSGISQALSNDSLDIQGYKGAIDRIYGGFQHAFLASLAGIIGTVLLLLVKFLLVNPLRESVFYQLDWVTQTRLIPLFTKPNRMDQVVEILLTTATKFETAVTHLQSLSEDTKESVASTKNVAVELQQFAKQVSDMTESFKAATGENSPFYQAHQQVTHYFEQVGTNFNQLIQQHQDLLTHSRELTENLLKEMAKEVQQFMVSQSVLFHQNLSNLMISTGGVTRDLQKLIAELNTQQIDYLAEIRRLSQNTERSAITVADATEQLIEFLRIANEHAQQTIAQLSQISLGSLARKVEEKAVEHTQAILEELNQIDSLKRIEQTLTELPKRDYAPDMQDLEQVLREIQGSVKTIQERRVWNWFKKQS